ncbi:MAG: PBP1A family penicillin-binding protein [candidate division Zixibacteria bacterium]|nr:PBP1A family penicillin-binding protein [candidate division Zixibacteria bacterium]
MLKKIDKSKDAAKKPWFARPVIWIFTFLVLLSVWGLIRTYQIYESELPSIDEVYNIEPPLKTKIYARDGVLLQEFYNQNRIMTPYAQFPEHLPKMLMAVEDQEFYEHWGINVRRIFITAVKNITQMRIEGGASTITQQLARMLFLNRKQTLERKIKEALTAIKLERMYSKDEIMEMYLNLYYFHRAYGVSAAAHVFFDKKAPELTVSECAVILGMLRGPVINSPFNNPDKALAARNRVLFSYYSEDGITQQEFDSLKALPLEINLPKVVPGKAPYFTEFIRQYIERTYGVDKLYNGGLKVYTTLDWDLQQAAESSLVNHLDSLQKTIESRRKKDDPMYTEILPDTVDEFGDSILVFKTIQGAASSINNENGDILIMIGGKDFAKTKFNRAVQAPRQPGSAFKPFIYTAAIDNGWTPDSILYDNSIVLDIPGTENWRPHNFDNKYLGRMTLRTGLKKSRNMIAAKLILKIHPELAVYYAEQMGIKSKLRAVPSLAMGSSEVRLEELVGAYSVFPNGGIRVNPRHILKIIDRYDNILEDNTVVRKEEVLSEETAYIMVTMLQSVMEPGGTGHKARWLGFTRPAGGKTGTSNNFRDNWYLGFTPQVTSGVWVGFDDFISIGRNMTGSANGLPIWTKIMLAAHKDLPIEDFNVPDGMIFIDVCEESGKLATEYCRNVIQEIFTANTVPTEKCDICTGRKNDESNPADTAGTIRF